MLLVDLTQNSREWHDWRRPRIGASECAGIMGRDPYRTPYGVWQRKIHGEENFTNADIERGVALEKEARIWISKELGKEFIPMCGQNIERPWQIASLDCYHCDDSGILSGEIKSPRDKKILEIKKRGVPEYWMWQLQHQMAVSGADKMFFLAYSIAEKVIIWIDRDDRMIEALNRTETIFYENYLRDFTPPPFLEEEAAFIKKPA